MPDFSPKIYTSGDTLPEGLMEENFFHSRQLFEIFRNTPRHRPFMVVLQADDGRIVAQMLAVVRYRTSWFPPYYYMHCRIMGEGAYCEEAQGDTFGLMLLQLTKKDVQKPIDCVRILSVLCCQRLDPEKSPVQNAVTINH